MGKRHYSDSEDYDDEDYVTSRRPAKAPKTRKSATTKKNTKTSEYFSTDLEVLQSTTPQHNKALHIIDPSTSSAIQSSLLEWFDKVRDSRGMPWRKPFDPSLNSEQRSQRAYEVWVSEIMLQQTQVATVIPYYNAWMAKFPTIRELAAASIEEVNSLWKGLGYYSRASRLLAGAQKVVKDYKGELPDNAKDMESNIPGIGRYSAGAICSIAYGERAPVLDGNVHRLLSRLLALHAQPKAKPTLDILWSAAEALVQDASNSSTQTESSSSKTTTSNHPGDINQALIELGSTICKVRDPSCGDCPLRSRCRAYAFATKTGTDCIVDIEDACTLCEPLPEGSDVTIYPMKAERKKAREELDLVNVIEWCSSTDPQDRRFLLVKRPNKGLLAGLYEFVTTPDISSTSTKSDLLKLTSEQLISVFNDSLGVLYTKSPRDADVKATICRAVDVVAAGDVIHVFSHIKKTYRVQWLVLKGGSCPPAVGSGSIQPSPLNSKKAKSGKKREDEKSTSQPLSQRAMWVRLEDVKDANIGTGVGKVWDLVQRLWNLQ